ncbi:MAG: oligosaccharide flippase family protein [Psychroserpens sp.]|nr:oligosaccharide flippase family protein [Psychroserpens sp.]
MQDTQKSYSQIFKSTSLFGGVQLLTILVSIIRSKVVALLIGPAGMGIIGLLLSTLKVIGEFTKLGLDTTAVREIARIRSSEDHDQEQISEIVVTINKVVWFTGLLGIIATLLLSPLLSHIAFGNYDYTLAFIWISSSLLFNQLAQGKLAILQGFRRLKLLAKSNLVGNAIGLLVSIPLYYFLRLDAIVLVIILSSVINFFFSWLFSRQLRFSRVKLTLNQAFSKAKGMLNLGLMLSLHSSIGLVFAYLFQVFLSQVTGVDEVGYYLAGFMIINSYVGLVFNAMRTDYFPKLSGIADSIEDVNRTVSQQSVIGLLIVGPLIITLIIFLPVIIKILYTTEFLIITGFVAWAILGILFKTLSWSIGYVILAKGDNKLFIKTGLFFSTLLFGMNVIGYYVYGLVGVGISFLAYYIIHFIGLKIITARSYGLQLSRELIPVFSILALLSAGTFLANLIDEVTLKYGSFLILFLISISYSYYQLNKRVNFKSILQKIFNRSK